MSIIEQIMINLVDNAIKFTNEGNIRIFYENFDQDLIKVIVSDTGFGIGKNILEGAQSFLGEKENK
jgi:signal transduction histidine kinase